MTTRDGAFGEMQSRGFGLLGIRCPPGTVNVPTAKPAGNPLPCGLDLYTRVAPESTQCLISDFENQALYSQFLGQSRRDSRRHGRIPTAAILTAAPFQS